MKLIGKLVQAERNRDGINLIHYLGEFDWNSSVGYEIIWMELILLIILVNLNGKLVQTEKQSGGY